ncbi:MAG: polysaccharide biosynthesis/export family protein [Acidobacteria bacterium]|nr:polysaccharide biosynthesis/export family protein [Acidobacteriota bacterium]
MRRLILVSGLLVTPAGAWAQAVQVPPTQSAPQPTPSTSQPATPPVAAPPTTAEPSAPRATQPTVPPSGQRAPVEVAPAAAAAVDPSYVIGPDDVLSVLYWRDKETSAEAVVRPDGKITLPLINDIQAAGLTPDQLRASIQKASEQFFQDPNVSIVVKQVNSRKVYITGQVAKPGPYSLTSRTTVLQLLAQAGGLADFAKKDKVVVMRTESGQTQRYLFNYKDVIEGKRLEQNIELRPGDTVIVP